MNNVRSRKPRVVCLHSSGASARQWLPLADRLGDHWRVLSPDLYGHATAPAWTGAARDIVAADADRALRAFGDGPAHLVGHSYGAAVALTLALRHPERVQSLVVYEPVLFRLLREFAPSSREAREAAGVGADVHRALQAGLPELGAQRFVDYWSGAGTFATLSVTQREAIVRRMPAIAAHFASLWSHPAMLADFGALRMPVTLLFGTRTRTATRRIAELLQSAWPHATFQPMTALGHLGPITHPNTTAQRIAADLRRCERMLVDEQAAMAA